MALPNTFLISWWYTPDTKLGLYFNDFGLAAEGSVVSSSESKLTGKDYIDYSNGMGASLQEDYHFENMITNHPVENGTAISDHIIRQPKVITITGLITSMRPFVLGGLVPTPLSFSQLGEATQILIDMAEKNTGISLLTGLLYGKSYLRVNNLAVQSLDIPRNNTYGRTSIKFTMVLKQLIITDKNGTLTPSSFSQAQAADGVDIG